MVIKNYYNILALNLKINMMKKYNLYQRLKTEYTSEMNRVAVKFPDIVRACKEFLHKNYDIQNLTLGELQTFLVTISSVKDRYDLSYMDIMYGDEFFMSQEDAKERNEEAFN